MFIITCHPRSVIEIIHCCRFGLDPGRTPILFVKTAGDNAITSTTMYSPFPPHSSSLQVSWLTFLMSLAEQPPAPIHVKRWQSKCPPQKSGISALQNHTNVTIKLLNKKSHSFNCIFVILPACAYNPVKLCHYRPGRALKAPRDWGSHNF